MRYPFAILTVFVFCFVDMNLLTQAKAGEASTPLLEVDQRTPKSLSRLNAIIEEHNERLAELGDEDLFNLIVEEIDIEAASKDVVAELIERLEIKRSDVREARFAVKKNLEDFSENNLTIGEIRLTIAQISAVLTAFALIESQTGGIPWRWIQKKLDRYYSKKTIGRIHAVSGIALVLSVPITVLNIPGLVLGTDTWGESGKGVLFGVTFEEIRSLDEKLQIAQSILDSEISNLKALKVTL